MQLANESHRFIRIIKCVYIKYIYIDRYFPQLNDGIILEVSFIRAGGGSKLLGQRSYIVLLKAYNL